jgi:hypothetical protein
VTARVHHPTGETNARKAETVPVVLFSIGLSRDKVGTKKKKSEISCHGKFDSPLTE